MRFAQRLQRVDTLQLSMLYTGCCDMISDRGRLCAACQRPGSCGTPQLLACSLARAHGGRDHAILNVLNHIGIHSEVLAAMEL